MKRCGQWLCWLWVSATLMWAQTPSVFGLATDASGSRYDCLRVQTASLLNDFTFTAVKKSTEPAGDPESSPEPLAVAVIFRTAPVFSCTGPAPCGTMRPVGRGTFALPLSCGPPARA